jgi:hypothetical protein
MEPRGLFLVILTASLIQATPAESREIQFSSSIPAHQVQLLQRDLSHPIAFADEVTLRTLLDTPDLGDDSIKQWIKSRVGYIVGENEDIEQNVVPVSRNFHYPNPGILPAFEKPVQAPVQPNPNQGPAVNNPHKAMIVMGNLGTGIYLDGKMSRQLWGYRFKTATNESIVSVTSPRVGLLQVGEGLFKTAINPHNPNASSNSLLRLSVLIHEARHSDGRGTSTGFTHAICPRSHSYYNVAACDRNENGPYSIEAEFMKQTIVHCLKDRLCTAGEAEVLSFMAVDNYSRIIGKGYWDPAPEGNP